MVSSYARPCVTRLAGEDRRGRHSSPTAKSTHRRHHELRSRPYAGRPPCGDGLELGIEPHTFGPMHVVIAEQRRFPAAERVECHWHRDRHVDADHTYLNLMSEFA